MNLQAMSGRFQPLEVSMDEDAPPDRAPASDQLHPLVYKAAAGLVLCFVMSAWMFFDRQNDIAELLGFASLLLFIVVLLPLLLWRVWRRQQQAEADDGSPLFRHWASGDFGVWGGQLKGSHAAIDALLPLVAVAGGMVALGIVFALTATAS
jgi:hypothetical protein